MMLFNHTLEQKQLLTGLVQVEANKLVETSFNNPADDHATIREFAYRQGRMHAFGALLRDDFPQPEIDQLGDTE